MKTQENTSVSKLVARFDKELKVLLMADLNKARQTNQLVNTIKQRIGTCLSVA